MQLAAASAQQMMTAGVSVRVANITQPLLLMILGRGGGEGENVKCLFNPTQLKQPRKKLRAGVNLHCTQLITFHDISYELLTR